jgi:hypothetical protein
MKRLVVILLAAIGFMAANAQNRDFYYQVFDLDTVTNAGTVTFVFDKATALEGLYEYSWQVEADSLSGSTAAVAYLEESNDYLGTTYTPVSEKTVTIDGPGNSDGILTGTMYGTRQRLRVVGTGTQSTKVYVAVVYKKKNGR